MRLREVPTATKASLGLSLLLLCWTIFVMGIRTYWFGFYENLIFEPVLFSLIPSLVFLAALVLLFAGGKKTPPSLFWVGVALLVIDFAVGVFIVGAVADQTRFRMVS